MSTSHKLRPIYLLVFNPTQFVLHFLSPYETRTIMHRFLSSSTVCQMACTVEILLAPFRIRSFLFLNLCLMVFANFQFSLEVITPRRITSHIRITVH